MSEPQAVRLLPWSTTRGGPCFLVGDGTGYVSRLADRIEAGQLGMADDLLGYADDMLVDRTATATELHFLARQLTESLREVRRVAEGRGARLSASEVGSGDDQ